MLSLVLAATAVPQVAIPPSGPWNVETSENLCLLSRPHGTAPTTFLVGFQPVFTQERMELYVIVPSRGANQETGTATVVRQPDGRKFSGRFFSVGMKGDRRLTRITVERALFDELPATSELEIKAGRLQTRVGIVRPEKALPVFRECERDLLQSWGVDPGTLTSGNGARPTHDVYRYFGSDDYPREAVAKGNVGRVTTVLSVDAAGKVSSCRAVVGAGAVLDGATCARAMLIPFTPGTDAGGRKIPSIYILTVHWNISDRMGS